jgi:hypothetical protein
LKPKYISTGLIIKRPIVPIGPIARFRIIDTLRNTMYEN